MKLGSRTTTAIAKVWKLWAVPVSSMGVSAYNTKWTAESAVGGLRSCLYDEDETGQVLRKLGKD